MFPAFPPLKKVILVLGDIAVFIAALALALIIRHWGSSELAVIAGLYRFAAPFLVTLWLAGLAAFGLYDPRTAKNEPRYFERIFKALLFNLAVTVFIFYVTPEFRLRPLFTLLFIFTALGILLSAWRGIYNALLARIAKERVLFLGMSREIVETAGYLAENPQLGFVPVGFVANGGDGPASAALSNRTSPVFPAESNLGEIIRKRGASVVVVSHRIRKTRSMVRSLLTAVPLGATITEFPRLYESVTGKVPVELIGETWFLENLIGMKRPKYDFAKRILDLTTAFVIGLAAAALLPFVAAAIVLSTPGDILRRRRLRAHGGDGIVFFRQKRIGKNGASFGFVKFRSQVLGAEKISGEKNAGPDPRSYLFGNFLRKTYLDELPQLWNVVKGEMSFVGPRPERPEFVRELERKIPFYRMRELVLPGITGWAQISMADDASVSDAPEKIQYDLYYIKNRSIFLDIAILLKTALKLLQRSGR